MDYDVDGVELEFFRREFLFAKSDTEEGTLAFNGLMREFRAVADEAQQKKGRPQAAVDFLECRPRRGRPGARRCAGPSIAASTRTELPET